MRLTLRTRLGTLTSLQPNVSSHMPDSVAASATRLEKACHDAYDRYPSDCSHAVVDVSQHVLDPSFPYRTANDLMTFFATPNSGWRRVSELREVSELANTGIVVVGGLQNEQGEGHVLVVMPGPFRMSGGFMYEGHRMRSHGLFPPAMSTSIISYPGAMSRGEKTVRDPWSAADWQEVTFWAWVR